MKPTSFPPKKRDGKTPARYVSAFRKYFYIIITLEFSLYVIISSISIHSPSLYSEFAAQQKSIVSQPVYLMFLSIFPHNLYIATIEFIPVIGLVFLLLSTGVTAAVISVEGVHYGYSGFYIFASLMLFPHSWLELPSYAVAASSGTYLMYVLIKRGTGLVEGLKRVFYLYIFVVIELAAAGAFETTEIYMENTYASPYDVEYSLLLWILAIPVILLLIKLLRRINTVKPAGKIETEPAGDTTP